MKTIIAGSRDITDPDVVDEATAACGWTITQVVSGTARGVDKLGEIWASQQGIRIKRFPPDWDGVHGKGAGKIRNIDMAHYAEAAVIIWDGISPGTRHMIQTAKRLGLRYYVYRTDRMQQKSLMANQAPPYEKKPVVGKLDETTVTRLYIIDGNYMMNRANHGYQHRLTNKDGDDVTIVYGFLQSLGAELQRFNPTHLVVVFDGPKSKASRLAIDPEYKANRDADTNTSMDGLCVNSAQQMSWLKSLLPVLGIHVIVSRGNEADDVIGGLVHMFSDVAKIMIATRDKDLMQLVQRGVRVYDGRTDVIFDQQRVAQQYGVRPDQIVDYLCLLGDKVDNIKGCPGIGHKGATDVLTAWEFDDIPAFMKHMRRELKRQVNPKEWDAVFKKQVSAHKKIAPWVDDGGYELAASLINLDCSPVLVKDVPVKMKQLIIADPTEDAGEWLTTIGIRSVHSWFMQHLKGTHVHGMFVKRKRRL